MLPGDQDDESRRREKGAEYASPEGDILSELGSWSPGHVEPVTGLDQEVDHLRANELTPKSEWNIEKAEALLNSLRGVVSARVVARPGGVIEEIHLLTEGDVPPKQSVRNVESALLAHFGLKIDHRKVSVAQTGDEQATTLAAFDGFGGRSSGEGRFLFVTHRVGSSPELCVKVRGSSSMLRLGCLGDLLGLEE